MNRAWLTRSTGTEGKASVVVHYRTFRNSDPPGLVHLWNEALCGRGAVTLSSSTLLEHHVFAKPYFDPAGLMVAVEENRLVGFAHAGFGPKEDQAALATTTGVLAMLVVLPSHRRRGIGSELLRRCETYLRERGARALQAGADGATNPFYFGLYGGSESSGFLTSEATLGLFLARHHYQPFQTYQVLHRHLPRSMNIVDGRFPALRRRYEFFVGPQEGAAVWWRECVTGLLEMRDCRVEEKATGHVVARGSYWEMEAYSRSWNECVVGLRDLEVRSDLRRQGLAKFLLAQLLRYLQEQYFSIVEVQVPNENVPGTRLFQNLGFEVVDVGHVYRRAEA
jgi:ribosomal protein S18 acetylase RimI-like enzyme